MDCIVILFPFLCIVFYYAYFSQIIEKLVTTRGVFN
jgi:hypothetical protein